MEKATTIPNQSIAEAIDKLISEIALAHGETERLAIVGVANGGVKLAELISSALTDKLGRSIPCGIANITFERDDIGSKPIPKIAAPTNFPFSVDRARIILVDDVLFTGRTVRAAINELFAQGRPSFVKLAVLIDRGHRRLPIEPQFTGITQSIDPTHKVEVIIDCEQPQNHAINVIPHE